MAKSDESPTIMTKQESVLHRTEFHGDYSQKFTNYDEDTTPETAKVFYMPNADWEDMGNPEKITVTVVPWDVLNDEVRENNNA